MKKLKRCCRCGEIKVPVVTFEEVDSLSESDRGVGGFWSSGK